MFFAKGLYKMSVLQKNLLLGIYSGHWALGTEHWARCQKVS